MARLRLLDVFEGKRNALLVLGTSVVLLLALELLIFIVAASSAGEQSRVEVLDKRGSIVYQTAGNTVAHLDRWHFEKQYGNLDNFDIRINTVHKPFPVHSWVSASVGAPVVLILLVSYLVKVYLTLLHGSESTSDSSGGGYPVAYGQGGSFVPWATLLNSSVFYLGVFIAAGALIFWMVPNLLGDALQFGMSILRESRWFVLAAVASFAAFLIWLAYLRYRLSKRMMDQHYSLERYRLDQQLHFRKELSPDMPEQVSRSLEG